MSLNPVFTATGNCASVAGTATANTSRTVFATGFDVITGASGGTRVEGIWFTAVGTTTAGVIRIWHFTAGAYKLIGELLVTAITPSATVAVFQAVWKPLIPGGFILNSGEKIGFTTHNAEAFNATPVAGDF